MTQDSGDQQITDEQWLHASFGAGAAALFAFVSEVTIGEPFFGIALALFSVMLLDFITRFSWGDSDAA